MVPRGFMDGLQYSVNSLKLYSKYVKAEYFVDRFRILWDT